MSLVDRLGLFVKAGEDHPAGQWLSPGPYRGDGDIAGLMFGKTIDAGTDGRKGDGFNVVLHGQAQAVVITLRQQLGFPVIATLPDRADTVNDVFSR